MDNGRSCTGSKILPRSRGHRIPSLGRVEGCALGLLVPPKSWALSLVQLGRQARYLAWLGGETLPPWPYPSRAEGAVISRCIFQKENARDRPGHSDETIWGESSGAFGRLGRQRAVFGIAQDIAAAPDGLDIIVAAGGGAELFAELADEDVDDLQLRLVHAAVKVI